MRRAVGLSPGEIDVWYASPDHFKDPAVLASFASWLSPAERLTHKGFRSALHQHTYLVAHALMRGSLCHASGIAPENWQFRTNEFGKLFVQSPVTHRELQFNLTHTTGLVAVSVCAGNAIGIDTEPCVQRHLGTEIISDILTEQEYLDYLEHPDEKKQHRLLSYWTLKEAFVKATGFGLSAGIKTFCFDFNVGAEPKVQFLSGIIYSELIQDPQCWRFWQKDLPTGHILAIASHSPTAQKRFIKIEEAHWLQDMGTAA